MKEIAQQREGESIVGIPGREPRALLAPWQKIKWGKEIWIILSCDEIFYKMVPVEYTIYKCWYFPCVQWQPWQWVADSYIGEAGPGQGRHNESFIRSDLLHWSGESRRQEKRLILLTRIIWMYSVESKYQSSYWQYSKNRSYLNTTQKRAYDIFIDKTTSVWYRERERELTGCCSSFVQTRSLQ